MKHALFSLLPEELAKYLSPHQIPSFRSKQILDWLYKKQIADFEQMSNLPIELRQKLGHLLDGVLPEIVHKQNSTDGTLKFLIKMTDGQTVEAVVLDDHGRKTLCISSQVGCAMNCAFCATGTQKLQRHLKAEEIVSQFFLVWREAGKLDNLVFMGMGEPLHNFENVLKAIKILSHAETFAFSQRRITVSTSGLEPEIRRLADEKLQITLALSLNATINELRNQIMPINRKYPLEKLKSALRYYNQKTSRKVTLEYVLLDGVNTHKQEARGIVKFSKGIICNVNLIPFNPFEGSRFKRPDPHTVKDFRSILEAENVPVATRKTRGLDIDAACGMLRTRWEQKREIPKTKEPSMFL